jgi:hypothetical protein
MNPIRWGQSDEFYVNRCLRALNGCDLRLQHEAGE